MNPEGSKLLKLEVDAVGEVVSRPNRFLLIADVEIAEGVRSRREKVHVHDPGRLREILYPGNIVQLRKAGSGKRETSWDLVSGRVGDEWVLVNSSYHRYITESILTSSISPIGPAESIRAEVRVGSSRLDFQLTDELGKVHFIEVKGCTLSRNGQALFPDAPTRRGTRHLRELIELKKEGFEADLIILIFAPAAECFIPNEECDPDFAEAFRDAQKAGVSIHPISMGFREGWVYFRNQLSLCDPS